MAATDPGSTGTSSDAQRPSSPGGTASGANRSGDGAMVVWHPDLLGYDLGDHPLDPVRLELTMALATELGVLDRPSVSVVAPKPADDAALLRVHRPDYLAAVKAAPEDPFFSGAGLGTPDNPIFERMHEASAHVAGATIRAAEAVWTGEVRRAVNIAGGLHHAMPDRAAGFCVYNDPAIAIARLLDLGAERVAYVDVDVHHGDGVQAVFYDDPRVLTISIHETPMALFPGTGYPDETGAPGAEGTAVNLALPPGVADQEWLRAFHAVVPGVLRAYRPQLLVTQCGADTHRLDPLADLRLSVDGQRASYLALRDLADELCEGRWIATGGGGYALVEAVPRAWTHLLAVLTGEPLDPNTPTPVAWRTLAKQRRPQSTPPLRLTDHHVADPSDAVDEAGDDAAADDAVRYRPWEPGGDPDPTDRAILATRQAVYPLHGLDPYDSRD